MSVPNWNFFSQKQYLKKNLSGTILLKVFHVFSVNTQTYCSLPVGEVMGPIPGHDICLAYMMVLASTVALSDD